MLNNLYKRHHYENNDDLGDKIYVVIIYIYV